MSAEIRIELAAATPLAVVRRVARQDEFATVIPAACGLVWNAVKTLNIAGAGRLVAVYLDCVFHLEIGVELPAPLPAAITLEGNDELVPSSTPAGRVATTTHMGPYQQLGQAHTAVQKWCASNGHKLAGPSWEVYGHWQDEWIRDPSQIRTDVFYLIQ